MRVCCARRRTAATAAVLCVATLLLGIAAVVPGGLRAFGSDGSEANRVPVDAALAETRGTAKLEGEEEGSVLGNAPQSLEEQLLPSGGVESPGGAAGHLPRNFMDDPSAIERFVPRNVTSIATTEQTRLHFRNTLVIMMMSPGRYHLVRRVQRHYSRFFANMVFVGPLTNNSFGVPIQGYDIVYGNEQYRAVREVIREHVLERRRRYDGFLYVSDDVMLHPWALVRKNMSLPWAAHMGIANLRSARPVWAVPGMSMQSKTRMMWPYWRKNRSKLTRAVAEGGEELREALFRFAKNTHRNVFSWSKYPAALRSDEALRSAVFFTIVDSYFIPFAAALRFADLCDLMAKHWVFGECAIATAIAALAPQYEQLSLQFYWNTNNAADCPRFRWAPWVDGFHRCRHDHPFTDLIFDSDDAARQRLTTDRDFHRWALRLHFDATKNEPFRPLGAAA